MRIQPRATNVPEPPLSVVPAVWSRLPGLRLVLLVANGLDNGTARPMVGEALAERQAILRAAWAQAEPHTHPYLARWREILRQLGAEPDRHVVSIEALVRRALGDRPVTSINPLVDLVTVVSLRYLVPVAGWDLDQLGAEPTLGFTTGTERFVSLGTAGWEPVGAGELAYLSKAEVIARHFVGRPSEHGKITASTCRALVVVAIPAGRAPNLGSRIREALVGLMATHFGVAAESWILRE